MAEARVGRRGVCVVRRAGCIGICDVCCFEVVAHSIQGKEGNPYLESHTLPCFDQPLLVGSSEELGLVVSRVVSCLSVSGEGGLVVIA